MSIDFIKAIAGVTALGSAIAVLATATGSFEQMQRGEPQWSAAVFSAALIAGLLVIGAGLTTNTLETILISLALTAFAFAAVAGIYLVIVARGNRPPPSIKLSFKGTTKIDVSGTVDITGMSPKAILKVIVIGERPGRGSDADTHGIEERLFQGGLGPDNSGSVSLPLDVPIPKGRYRFVRVAAWVAEAPGSCFVDAKGFDTPGCVVLRVPAPIGVPFPS